MRSLKFLFPYACQALLGPLLVVCFFATVSFLAAKPVSQLDLHGKALPGNWEAAVPNHGGYYPWLTIAGHPWLFTGALALLGGASIALYAVDKLAARQRDAGVVSPLAHRIAAVLPLATFAAAASWFVMHVAVVVKPA